MGNADESECVFPLTTLQIGDLQSYLSDLNLFLANESKRFYILVDNRPWLRNLGSRTAHFWQLMVTKSRLSPFANTRAWRDRKGGREACSSSNACYTNELKNWFSLVDTASLSHQKVLLPGNGLRNSLLPSSELQRILYGFIVFEVSWAHVRGISYFNELQTDTSLAIEAKCMKRWEFDSIAQASSCMSSWFSGTQSEQLLMKEYLDSAIGEIFCDAEEDILGAAVNNDEKNQTGYLSSEDFSSHCVSGNCSLHLGARWDRTGNHKPSPSNCSNKRRKVTKSTGSGDDVDSNSENRQGITEDQIMDSKTSKRTSGRETDETGCGLEVDTYPEKGESFPGGSTLDSKTSTCNSVSAIEHAISGSQFDSYSLESRGIPEFALLPSDTSTSNGGCIIESTLYTDVLILFRFNDRDLPFKLREVIMSDLRLLTLLEAGLPAWVIFLQSYPGFNNIYRPWMCPLARVLYVLISVVTVLIGFYDLYKNVPVLKATASRVCGPLFDWVENWEMASRIQYLGTMLFLNNFEKAVKFLIAATHAARSFFGVLVQPLAVPLTQLLVFIGPVWHASIRAVDNLFSVVWIVIEFSCTLVLDVFEILLLPFCYLLSLIWTISTYVLYPVFSNILQVMVALIRMVLALGSFLAFVLTFICDILQGVRQSVSSIVQFVSASGTTGSTVEVSTWHSLWNDLFSQVFCAIRSILYGFVAFFTACNRHRLSIYNHIMEFMGQAQRPDGRSSRSQHSSPTQSRQK